MLFEAGPPSHGSRTTRFQLPMPVPVLFALRYRRVSRALLFTVLLGFLLGVPCTADQGKRTGIAVIASHSAAPFEQFVEGFKNYTDSAEISSSIQVYHLDGDAARASQAIEKAKQSNPGVIVSLGSLATRAAITEAGGAPVVAGMVLTAEEMKSKTSTTGVYLEFPLDTQLSWIKKVLPDCRSLGVIYNPRKNLSKIEAATSLAQELGFRLYARRVDAPSDLPGALETLSREVEVLWAIPDDLVYSSQTARYILLFSFRNRIPLIGLSAEWVKAGALFSLEWDYQDMGAQCAEIAIKVLQGASAGSIPPSPPRKIKTSLNLKTALHMKVDISEELVKRSEVFK